MFDLAHQVSEIFAAPVARLWASARMRQDTPAQRLELPIENRNIKAAIRLRRIQKRLAREQQWRWLGANQFSGRLENGAPWIGSLHAKHPSEIHLHWFGSPLACRTERTLLLGTCAATPALEENLFELPLPIGSSNEWCQVRCNHPEFAAQSLPSALLESLLCGDHTMPNSLQVRLQCNRLSVSLTGRNCTETDLIRFFNAAIELAERANASNGQAYLNQSWSRRR